MKQRKRILSLLLVLSMMFSLSATAGATEIIPAGTETAQETSSVAEQNSLEESSVADVSDNAEVSMSDNIQDTAQILPAGSQTVTADSYQTIVHLDCGRKYFSVDYIKSMLYTMAQNGFDQLQLAFGNGGLRFILDDMDLKDDNGSLLYTSDAVKAAIQQGNKNFYDAGDVNELTEADMKAIIQYASKVGIEVVPLLNMPGHMDGILSSDLFSGLKLSGSEGSLDLNNSNAVSFGKALLKKYVDWFRQNGNSQYFNFGADEYGQGIRNPYIESSVAKVTYDQLINYMNDCAEIIEKASMTARCFNDFVCYNGRTSCDLYKTVQVCYWSNQWNGSEYNTVTAIKNAGYQLINTNQKWYYVPSKSDEYGYDVVKSNFTTFDVTKFQNIQSGWNATSTTYTEIPTGTSNIGAMFCVWCDTPSVDVELIKVQELIKAMADANPDYFVPKTIPDVEDKTVTDSTTGISVTAPELTGLTVSATTAPAIESSDAGKVLAFEITPDIDGNRYTESAIVRIPIPSEWPQTQERIRGYVVNEDQSLTQDIAGKVESVDSVNYFVFTVPHFSTIGLYALAAETVDISLTVGEEQSVPVPDKDLRGEYTLQPEGIAEVTVVYKETQGKVDVTPVSSVANNGKYYIKVSDGVYLDKNGKTCTTVEDAAEWTFTGSNQSGYRLTNEDGSYLRYSNRTLSTGTSASTFYFNNGTLYANRNEWWYGQYTYSNSIGSPVTISQTDPVKESTLTFKGLAVGDASVEIGGIKYIIHVSPVDLGKVTLPVNLWITNTGVVPTGWSSATANFNYTDTDGNRRSIYTLKASLNGVNTENGIELSSILPALSGTAKSWDGNTYDVVYWKSAYHSNASRQSTDGWTNNSHLGITFRYIRYWDNTWAYSIDGNEWIAISNVGAGAADTTKNQVNIWYRQKTTVTTEVETQIVDWGPLSFSANQCLLDFAVKYESGEVTPTSFPAANKTIGFDCPTDQAVPLGNGYVVKDTDGSYYRTVYGIAGVETDDYEIYMITVTPSNDSHSEYISKGNKPTSYTYDGTEKIAWAKTQEDIDKSVLTTITNPAIGGEAFLESVKIYQYQGLLVTYYLRAKANDDSLTVHYIDKTTGNEFYSYNIIVKQGTYFDNNINLPEITIDGETCLTGGKVTNKWNNPQYVSSVLSTMPEISSLYRYSNYTCEEVRRGTDTNNKEVFLYYVFHNTENFVVDFGLPVVITAASLGLENAQWTSSQVSGAQYGTAILDKDTRTLTYTPTEVLKGIETLQLTLKESEAVSAAKVTHTIYIYPATTVYYEEGFANYKGKNGVAWIDTGSKGDGTQTLTAAGKAVEANAQYGYDSKYAGERTGASNGTQATSTVIGDDAVFTFTGTGIDIYANSTTKTGSVNILIRNSAGSIVKLAKVNTKTGSGTSDATAGQDVDSYSQPILSLTGLDHDTYTVTIRHCVTDANETTHGEIHLDGFRVYGTLADEATNTVYASDKEENPSYLELRDKVLAALEITSTDPKGQVNAALSGEAAGATTMILTNSAVFTAANANDLLKNGPKNEIYLRKGQALVFNVATNRTVQIGLKALNGNGTTYDLSVQEGNSTTTDIKGQSITSATDMFYPLAKDSSDSTNTRTITVTITNQGDNILSVTKLKVCDDPSADFTTLTAEDCEKALEALGLTETVDPEPQPVLADAVLTITLKNAFGRTIGTTSLQYTGEEGERHAFSKNEVKKAVEAFASSNNCRASFLNRYRTVTVTCGNNSKATYYVVEQRKSFWSIFY